MEQLDIVRHGLLSPAVLCFGLGALARLLRSDLKLPDAVFQGLAIYLLLAIGMKGGVALAQSGLAAVAPTAFAAVGLGAVIPLWCFQILHRLGRFTAVDAAALSAHYGSVSAVTFLAALAYLDMLGRPAEPFMPAILAVMEVPAIAIALLLARQGGAWRHALHETLVGKSILLLVGGLVIGYVGGPSGYDKVRPFFEAPFQGALCLFLLELGGAAAARLGDLAAMGRFLAAFAIVMPVLHGGLGVVLGWLVGLSTGGAAVLGVLAASASYIAAPAAVRLALPRANPSYYLTAALAITFPFNLVIGLPLYVEFAHWISRS
jgi:hypothetical protein